MAEFPRITWGNIDGRQVPFTKPQHYKKGSTTETDLTGHDNPLPTADYGMTEGGLWIPKKVDDEGNTLTKVTGSKVEELITNQETMITALNRMGDGVQTDFTNSPGSKVLMAGDTDAGFYGFVQPHEFGKIDETDDFNGDNLAKDVGISQGSSQFSNTPWLKFSWQRRILLVPLKAIRSSISWDSIYQAGAVYGTGSDVSDGEQWMLENDHNYTEDDRVSQDAEVTIDGLKYKVRLFRGAGNDPTDSYDDSDRGSSGAENEWNNLILPLHERAPDNYRYNQYADTPRPDWKIGLTNEVLLTHQDFGTGSHSWCQETRDTVESDEESNTRRCGRGYVGASVLHARTSFHTSIHRGWLPVLELV